MCYCSNLILDFNKSIYQKRIKMLFPSFDNYLNTSTDRDAFIDAFDPDWQGNLPLTMLIAPGGEIIYTHDGIIDPLEVKKAIVGQLGRYFADD